MSCARPTEAKPQINASLARNNSMNTPLTDEDLFPFGAHKGKKMKDVSASYLDWLRGQKWLSDWPQVADYIERNKKAIDLELRRSHLL